MREPHPPSAVCSHARACPSGLWCSFSRQAGALNPHSPWPREAPTVPANTTVCLLPERGGAEGQGPVIQGVPGAAVPGGPQTLTSPPGLRLETPTGFFPPGHGRPQGLLLQPTGSDGKNKWERTNDNFFFWMVVPNAHLTPSIPPNDPQGLAGAGQGCCPKEGGPSIPCSQRGKEEVHHFDVIQLLSCV